MWYRCDIVAILLILMWDGEIRVWCDKYVLLFWYRCGTAVILVRCWRAIDIISLWWLLLVIVSRCDFVLMSLWYCWYGRCNTDMKLLRYCFVVVLLLMWYRCRCDVDVIPMQTRCDQIMMRVLMCDRWLVRCCETLNPPRTTSLSLVEWSYRYMCMASSQNLFL